MAEPIYMRVGEGTTVELPELVGALGDFLAAYPSKIRALINDTGDKTLIGAGIKRELKKGEEGDRNIANG